MGREKESGEIDSPYKESFPAGTRVQIASRDDLEQFLVEWKYHHKLQPEQLNYANRTTTVQGVGFCHGGDAIYSLDGIPGYWLEPCLRSV